MSTRPWTSCLRPSLWCSSILGGLRIAFTFFFFFFFFASTKTLTVSLHVCLQLEELHWNWDRGRRLRPDQICCEFSVTPSVPPYPSPSCNGPLGFRVLIISGLAFFVCFFAHFGHIMPLIASTLLSLRNVPHQPEVSAINSLELNQRSRFNLTG